MAVIQHGGYFIIHLTGKRPGLTASRELLPHVHDARLKSDLKFTWSQGSPEVDPGGALALGF
jgi:hypothetical protein